MCASPYHIDQIRKAALQARLNRAFENDTSHTKRLSEN